ncbi:molybdenum-dependent DNA-binding transcriptional regulator ModE [Peribacillus simplex]|uniref:hypothetical protein n=1 Tax=Peribacillus simplex TaxID=1478 RepID=UPI0024E1EAA4|nr:hypothetical protein [Peribacillus simplex]MDF9763803.1 molybdenum-dependent DNA-binding transcriptional regulator ModE [Peribacillus simplex]
MAEEKSMLEQYKELYAKEYDRLQQMQPESQEYAQLEKQVDQMQDVGERYEFVSSRVELEYAPEEKELLKEMEATLKKEMSIEYTKANPYIEQLNEYVQEDVKKHGQDLQDMMNRSITGDSNGNSYLTKKEMMDMLNNHFKEVNKLIEDTLKQQTSTR